VWCRFVRRAFIALCLFDSCYVLAAKLTPRLSHSTCRYPLGQCYKKSNSVDAITAFQSAVALLTDAGRLTQAAKLCKECAELYEQEDGEVAGAIELYEQAADLFALEESKSAAATCKGKVAELCSAALSPPDLLKAFQLYDELGRNSLESNLLKFHAKGYFLQAILCQLANNDAVGAEQSLRTYEGVDYSFAESREGKFAMTLVETVNGMDVEAFSTACFEFDRISKLDPWKTSMLVKVKRHMDDGEGGGGDEEDDVDLT
jgi:alpha-soluble NSF attachment protein